MAEKVAEAKIVVVHMVCDKCENGIMEPGTNILMSNPPLYPHKCDNCGYEQNYQVRYPYQRIVPIEPLREAVGRECDPEDGG